MKELNEIKKALYKAKPDAVFSHIRKGVAYYSTVVNGEIISFEIPVTDMGDADFTVVMQAQLLIRWITLF